MDSLVLRNDSAHVGELVGVGLLGGLGGLAGLPVLPLLGDPGGGLVLDEGQGLLRRPHDGGGDDDLDDLVLVEQVIAVLGVVEVGGLGGLVGVDGELEGLFHDNYSLVCELVLIIVFVNPAI